MRDLSNFRKIKEDQHSATLKHPKGHLIRIAKEALSPELRKQLAQVPLHLEGGGQVDEPDFNQNSSQMPQNPGQPVINIINSPQGAGQSTPMPAPTPSPAPFQPQMPEPGMGYQMGSGLRGALQDSTQAFGSLVAPVGQGMAGFAQGLAGSPEGGGGTGKPASPALSNMPLSAPQGSSLPSMDTNELGQLLSNQRQGVQNEADVLSQQGNEQAQAASEQSQQLMKAQQKHQMLLDQYTKEYEAIKKDVSNKHINPSHYLDNMSTGQKVTAAIGLVLGGIGGGMTHQENPALKFLNQQIDRDIKAQMASVDKKTNLLGYHLKMMGNMEDAMKMQTAMQMGIYAAKFAEAGAKAQGPIAQARALQAKNYYEYQAKIMLNEVAIKQALLHDSGADPGVAVRYLVDKDQQGKAYDQVDEAQNHAVMKRNLMDAFDRAVKENTLVGRAGRLGRQTPAIRELEAGILPFLKDATGRVNESEQEAARNLYPGILTMGSTDAEKRKAFEALLDSKVAHSRLKAFGVKVPKLPSKSAYPTRKQ